MRLVSDRPLTLFGTMHEPGQEFEVEDEKIAKELLGNPGIRRATAPRVIYETKPAHIETPEVQPETGEAFSSDPAGDVPVSDEKSETVDPEGDRELPSADVSEQGAPDPRRRRARSRSNS